MKATLLSGLCLCLLIPSASRAADDTNPPPRLTVELRDSSRVVGTSIKESLPFHSALLGDLTLAVKDIRTVECLSTNSAKLTTAGGDVLSVTFAAPTLPLNTSFGKVELTTGSIRRLSVAKTVQAGPHHAGLVALWSGEGDAKDSISGLDGTLLGDCGFGEGQSGRAFEFSSPGAAVKIPAAPALDVGNGPGFTLEAWINPADVSQTHPIFEWNNSTYWGVHFHIAPGQAFNTTTGAGELYANIPDEHGGWHQLSTPAGVVVANQYQLVALTYDRARGTATIYCNGKAVGRGTFGRFTPLTSYDLYLGHRQAPEGEAASFAGLLDEAAIYNRALTAAEIREDYEAQKPE